MSTHDEINNAIAAHGAWKQKLRSAIETGECESTPSKVKQDCNCSFGKWLHERISSNEKKSPYYTEALSVHAQFHLEAGEILDLALKGDKNLANVKMKLGGEFAHLSSKLTHTMKSWQSSL